MEPHKITIGLWYVWCFLATSICAAQQPHPDTQATLKVVEQVFDALRTQDSTAARQLFLPNARIQVIPVGKGQQSKVITRSVDDFVAAVGMPRKAVWNEVFWDPEVQIDQNMAQIWAPYAFYIDGQLSHCGIDALQLFKSEVGWKILQIAYTRQTEDCQVPDEVKPR